MNAQQISELKHLANIHNSLDAQLQLGTYYLANAQYSEAITYLQKVVDNESSEHESNSAIAAYLLGELYQDGIVVEYNPYLATNLFKKSALQGYIPAVYQYGNNLYNGEGCYQDIDKGLGFMELAAEHGDFAKAQNEIGMLYLLGENKPKNVKKASELFEMAAQQGYKDAQFNLALIFYKGDLGKVDYKQAAQWFYKAAQQNDAEANSFLGSMYLKGEGVIEDLACAIDYFFLALNIDPCNEQALKQLFNIVKTSGFGDMEKFKLYLQYLEKAIEMGSTLAQNILNTPHIKLNRTLIR